MVIKLILSFFIWAFLWLPVAVLGLAVVPIALMIGTNDSHFYKLFWFWDNYNDGVFGGATPGFIGFWGGFIWAALRNPCSNWGKLVLGAPQPVTLNIEGNTLIGDGVGGMSGKYWITGGNFWEYYLIKPYTLFGVRKCIRLRIGWKLLRNLRPKAPFVFSFNPFHAYHGV